MPNNTKKDLYLNIPVHQLKELTANEANLLAFIKLRLNISNVYIEEQKYVCLTYNDILEYFKNISLMTVRRTIVGLLKKKRIKKIKIKTENKCNPNSSWYTVLDNKIEQSECSNRTVRVFKVNSQSVQSEQSECSNRTDESPQTPSPSTDSEPLNKYINKYIINKENTPLPPHEGDMVFIEERNQEEERQLDHQTRDDPIPKPVEQVEPSCVPEPKKRQTKRPEKDNQVFDEQFETWWDLYPRKDDKKAAKDKFKIALKHISFDQLIQLTKAYVDHRDTKSNIQRNGTKYIPQAKTWLHGERWKDFEESVSVSQTKEQQVITDINQKYQGKEKVFWQHLVHEVGAGVFCNIFKESAIVIFEDRGLAHLIVPNDIIYDRCRIHFTSQIKKSFNTIGVQNIELIDKTNRSTNVQLY